MLVIAAYTWIRSSYLRNGEEASSVSKLPVSKLMGQHSNDLLGLALLHQGVVDDNVLLPRQTVEIGVGVGASLATIDDVKLVQREVESRGKLLDLGLELAVFKRRQLVEEGQDEDRVGSDHEELENGGENPEVRDERGAGLLDDLEEGSHDGRGNDGSQDVGLDEVADEELRSLLVEPELLLQNECAVDASRQVQDLLDQKEGQEEGNRVANLAGEARRSIFQKQVAGPGPELGQEIELDEDDILDLGPEAADNLEAGFGAAIVLRLVERFAVNLLGEDGRRVGLLQNTVLAEGKE